MEKLIYFFYIFFQGIILFQFAVFLYLYRMSKRRELLFYSIFLFLIALNFFIADPSTFGWGDDETVLNSDWFKLVNTPIVIVANIFYVLFLVEFYSTLTKHKLLFRILNLEVKGLILALIIFLTLFAFGITSNLLFNILNFLGIVIGIWLITIIVKQKLPYTKPMVLGFASNLTGTLLTVFMLILLSQGVKHLLVYDYPFVFVKLGVLLEILFFNIAIFKKWNHQEKQLAVQQLESRFAIERVRNKISSQLHDDIGSTLSGVSMYTHLANDLLEKGEQNDAKKSLRIIQKSTDEMVEKLGDLVWSTSSKQDSLQLVFERLEQYGFDMCSAKNIQFKANILISNFNLPAENRYQLYLFCKEAINNAVKYSGANLLKLTVKESNQLLLVNISDDGKGFDFESIKRGNGLDNMQKRADELNADFNMQSKPGGGCLISLKVKITQ
jgi:signal transduction histidine kinase